MPSLRVPRPSFSESNTHKAAPLEYENGLLELKVATQGTNRSLSCPPASLYVNVKLSLLKSFASIKFPLFLPKLPENPLVLANSAFSLCAGS